MENVYFFKDFQVAIITNRSNNCCLANSSIYIEIRFTIFRVLNNGLNETHSATIFLIALLGRIKSFLVHLELQQLTIPYIFGENEGMRKEKDFGD